MQIPVFYQVLITGKVSFAETADVPLSLDMVTINMPLEVEFRVIDFVASWGHAAVQNNQMLSHYIPYKMGTKVSGPSEVSEELLECCALLACSLALLQ